MIKKIAICGVGRLGLPLALNFERRAGLDVIGYDVNESYVSALNARKFRTEEPQVNELLAESTIPFHHDVSAILDAQLAIICVRTDSDTSGAYDLNQLWCFLDAFDDALRTHARRSIQAIIINCNVNPGTSRVVAERFKDAGIEVYFWPEWVKQGSIVLDQINPPVTVLGTQTGYRTLDDVLATLRKIDRNQTDPKIRILSLIEAEICKISLNCFLTVKISFANMVANLLEELGLESTPVLEALSNDPRIGHAFMKPGFGYGGPCLPRDNRALSAFAGKFGVEMPLCTAADEVNEQRHQQLSKQAVRQYNSNGISPELDTLSYKAGVPIFTESQQLRFVTEMSRLGIASSVMDKAGLDSLDQLSLLLK